jgi:hypothetical protein
MIAVTIEQGIKLRLPCGPTDFPTPVKAKTSARWAERRWRCAHPIAMARARP